MELEVARILRALRKGEFVRTHHAKVRMKQRRVSMRDVWSVGRTHTEIVFQGNGIYKITGLDLESETLTVIATYQDGAIIITVY